MCFVPYSMDSPLCEQPQTDFDRALYVEEM